MLNEASSVEGAVEIVEGVPKGVALPAAGPFRGKSGIAYNGVAGELGSRADSSE